MEPKFFVDNMLGRLAVWLRIIGYDTLYFSNIEDKDLIQLALQENRIILTRDTRLIKRKLVNPHTKSTNSRGLSDSEYFENLPNNNSLINSEFGVGVKHFILIKNDLWHEQIKELAGKIKLDLKSRILNRCVFCNEILSAVEKEKVKGKIPGYVYETQENFVSCPKCQRIFWQGTHILEIKKFLENLSISIPAVNRQEPSGR